MRQRHLRRRRDRHASRMGHVPSSWLKPEKFDGQGSFETFLLQFENCAMYYGWTTADKVVYLRGSLTGAAAQLLWGTEGLPYGELLEKLRSRYSGIGLEEKFRTELRCRRRARGESLRELAQDIRRLMMLAHPGERSTLSEYMACEAFLTALGDTDFELKIREREPRTMDDTLMSAQRLEAIKMAAESSAAGRQRFTRQVAEQQPRHTTDLEMRMDFLERALEGMCMAGQPSELALVDPIKAAGPATRTVGKHDASVQSSTEFSKRLEETEAACQAAEQLVEQLKKDNDAWNKRVGRLQHLQQLRMLPSNVMQPEDTRQEANISYSATKGQQNSRGPQCFHCEEYGHIARNCFRRFGGSKQENKAVGAKQSSGSSKCVNQASGGGRESAAVGRHI